MSEIDRSQVVHLLKSQRPRYPESLKTHFEAGHLRATELLPFTLKAVLLLRSATQQRREELDFLTQGFQALSAIYRLPDNVRKGALHAYCLCASQAALLSIKRWHGDDLKLLREDIVTKFRQVMMTSGSKRHTKFMRYLIMVCNNERRLHSFNKRRMSKWISSNHSHIRSIGMRALDQIIDLM